MSDKNTPATVTPAKVIKINGRKVTVTNGRCKMSAVKIAVGKGDAVTGGKALRAALRRNFANVKGDKKLINGKREYNDGNKWGETVSVDSLKRIKLVK